MIQIRSDENGIANGSEDITRFSSLICIKDSILYLECLSYPMLGIE